MILPLLLFAFSAAPTATDLQAIEESRVLTGRIDHSRDGRAYVEFPPNVETRNARCAAAARKRQLCRYEARLKEMLEVEYGPWRPVHVELIWRRGKWCPARSRR